MSPSGHDAKSANAAVRCLVIRAEHRDSIMGEDVQMQAVFVEFARIASTFQHEAALLRARRRVADGLSYLGPRGQRLRLTPAQIAHGRGRERNAAEDRDVVDHPSLHGPPDGVVAVGACAQQATGKATSSQNARFAVRHRERIMEISEVQAWNKRCRLRGTRQDETGRRCAASSCGRRTATAPSALRFRCRAHCFRTGRPRSETSARPFAAGAKHCDGQASVPTRCVLTADSSLPKLPKTPRTHTH